MSGANDQAATHCDLRRVTSSDLRHRPRQGLGVGGAGVRGHRPQVRGLTAS